MPGTGQPQHPVAVHQMLTTAHTLLDGDRDEEFCRFTVLLTRAARLLPIEDHRDLDPPDLARAVAEAAGQLTACAHTPLMPGDPNLEVHLEALDRLPRTARIGLLAAAVRRTAPDADGASPLVTGVSALGRPPLARRRTTGRCPCACNSGEFCGGCGHAGCGGRR